MQLTETGLPVNGTLRSLMDVGSPDGVCEIISGSLIGPLDDLLNRPSKKIRAEVVELGLCLSFDEKPDPKVISGFQNSCFELSKVIEFLHAGSLVVDDIADQSQFRRGLLTLHEKYGMPIALNAGNWLYFWAIEKIRDLGLEPKTEVEMYRLVNRTLNRAHIGQAIDVGAPIDHIEKSKVKPVCMASIELKTGALFGLAIGFGAILGESSPDRSETLIRFGHRFGVALQLFNDIGALNLDSSDPKKLEDFVHRRPSWIWAVAADELTDAEYQIFRDAVRQLPDERPISNVLKGFELVDRATAGAETYLEDAIQDLRTHLPQSDYFEEKIAEMRRLGQRLTQAYG